MKRLKYIFFYTGKNKKKTFSRPAKIMDHVESHLRKEPRLIIAYCYLVCEATGLVLGTVGKFKRYVKNDHGITLRDPWYVR